MISANSNAGLPTDSEAFQQKRAGVSSGPEEINLEL